MARPLLGTADEGWPKPPPVTIHKVYAGRTGDSYLTRPTEELARIDEYLAGIEKSLGDVKFVGGEMIPQVQVDEVIPRVEQADALLIIHLSGHGGDAPALERLVDVGRPTVVFTQPFSGHGWMDFPRWHRQGKRVVLLPTSDWSELVPRDGPGPRPAAVEVHPHHHGRTPTRHRRRLRGRARSRKPWGPRSSPSQTTA